MSFLGIIVPFKKNPNFVLAKLPSGERREFSRPRSAEPGQSEYPERTERDQ